MSVVSAAVIVRSSATSLSAQGAVVFTQLPVMVSTALLSTKLPSVMPPCLVAIKSPVAELNVKFVPDLGAKLPVAVVVNNIKFSVSELSSATVIALEVNVSLTSLSAQGFVVFTQFASIVHTSSSLTKVLSATVSYTHLTLPTTPYV